MEKVNLVTNILISIFILYYTYNKLSNYCKEIEFPMPNIIFYVAGLVIVNYLLTEKYVFSFVVGVYCMCSLGTIISLSMDVWFLNKKITRLEPSLNGDNK